MFSAVVWAISWVGNCRFLNKIKYKFLWNEIISYGNVLPILSMSCCHPAGCSRFYVHKTFFNSSMLWQNLLSMTITFECLRSFMLLVPRSCSIDVVVMAQFSLLVINRFKNIASRTLYIESLCNRTCTTKRPSFLRERSPQQIASNQFCHGGSFKASSSYSTRNFL